jgi:transcriptional regulator with XRE-family HTH domain
MRLDHYLAAEGLSLSEFARRINVRNARTVQRYVKGARTPHRSIMAAIARETGGKVQPGDFFDLEAAE